jgi:hypothetical protein
MWAETRPAAGTKHVASVVWRWKAHNRVTKRLRGGGGEGGEGGEGGGGVIGEDGVVDYQMGADSTRPVLFPPVGLCPECYKESLRDGGGSMVGADDFSGDPWSDDQSIFLFLQEIFCFRSDRFQCAQFYDPSQDNFVKNSGFGRAVSIAFGVLVVIIGFGMVLLCVM